MKNFDGGITFSKSLRVVGGVLAFIALARLFYISLIVVLCCYINVLACYLCITSVFSFDSIGIDNKYYVTRSMKCWSIWFSICEFLKGYQTSRLNTQQTHILYNLFTSSPHHKHPFKKMYKCT